jgi:GNAT superfamily N-acetyltransferase
MIYDPSKMYARIVMPEDKEDVLEMARMQVEETLPHLDFDREVTENTFDQSIKHADPTIFVCEYDGKAIGYLLALLEGYAFTRGLFCVQEVIFVRPEHRGSRAAMHLTKEFIAWAEDRGARETIFGIANGFQPERTARFFEHFGAEQVGFFLKIKRDPVVGFDGQTKED